jgi:hypothetical protein
MARWAELFIRSNDASYVTRPIFKEYVREIVAKYFNSMLETMHLNDFSDVLICDNCSSHIDKEMMAVLVLEGIRLVSFPPHTPHLFQLFDLDLWGFQSGETRDSCQSP